MFLLNQNEAKNNEIKQDKKILLDSSDLLIKIKINNISNDNIKMILEYLNSNDEEKNHTQFYPSENNTSQEFRNTETNVEVPETKLDDSTPRNESIDSNH